MNMRPEQIHLARQWIARAEEDLLNAEHTLTMRDNCPLSTVCFHLDQVATGSAPEEKRLLDAMLLAVPR